MVEIVLVLTLAFLDGSKPIKADADKYDLKFARVCERDAMKFTQSINGVHFAGAKVTDAKCELRMIK